MEYDQLKGFVFVAKLGSFTRAAAKLYLSQPAVSLQVKALEEEIGERLFDRVGRRIRLTRAGEILFKEAEALVGKLDEIHSVVEEIKGVSRGRLRIGASDTTSIYVLPQLLKEFATAHPHVDLRISSSYSTHVVQSILDREIDLGIATLPIDDDRVESRALFEQELCCITAHEHPFASRQRVRLDEVARARLILLEKGSSTRTQIDELLTRKDSSPPSPSVELSNFEIIKRYVAAGLGVSLVPSKAVDETRDQVRKVTIQPRIAIRSGVVYRHDHALSHVARAFLDLADRVFPGQSTGSRLHGTTSTSER